MNLRQRLLIVLPPIAVGIMIVIAWELLCRAYEVPSYLFPAPSAVVRSLVENASDLLFAL